MEFGKGALEGLEMTLEFWRNKKVLLTGHTGFKGSWLSLWLQSLGADLTGYALAPPTQPNLYMLAGVGSRMQSVHGDILDLEQLWNVVRGCEPEIVFHLAAQALVRHSYANPIETYQTNVNGTANVLEVVRHAPTVRAVVIVTSDKCYENSGRPQAYVETDPLGGDDPYSSSKAAAELVTAAYRKSYFISTDGQERVGIASARSGNVIGGGDWAADRLIPDLVRAALDQQILAVRNPDAVRPWQHVLEPLCGYLTLAEKLYQQPGSFSESWNFGPDESECWSVLDILELFHELWGSPVSWRIEGTPQPRETRYLRLDSTKAQKRLGWRPKWKLRNALEVTLNWYRAYRSGQDLQALVQAQISCYQAMASQVEILRS
jgi:CDP-glucose 4,6-dehydratase